MGPAWRTPKLGKRRGLGPSESPVCSLCPELADGVSDADLTFTPNGL